MTTFLTQRRPIGVAHRGFGQGAAENSLAAVQQAVDLGFECVEIDVRITSDGHLVVWHDPVLPASAGPELTIADMTFDEVTSIDLPGRAGVAPLADFLTTWPELTFILDVKREECVEPLARLLTDVGAVERVCIHGSDTDGPRETWVVADDWMR
ncbi:glycerophosphodiester phosphodiesterase, partial [Bacillus subtilis]